MHNDQIGECLRDSVFIRPGGGYLHLEMCKRFYPLVELTTDAITVLAAIHGIPQEEVLGVLAGTQNDYACDRDSILSSRLYTDDNIVVGIYWDGDGVLVIKSEDVIAVNSDCKKSSGWVVMQVGRRQRSFAHKVRVGDCLNRIATGAIFEVVLIEKSLNSAGILESLYNCVDERSGETVLVTEGTLKRLMEPLQS